MYIGLINAVCVLPLRLKALSIIHTLYIETDLVYIGVINAACVLPLLSALLHYIEADLLCIGVINAVSVLPLGV